MKHLIFLLLTLPLLSIGQVNQVKESNEKSKIENFTLRTGSLLKIESIGVGKFVEEITIYSTKIKASGFVTIIKVTDLSTKSTLSGIKLSFFLHDKDYSCFLDIEDIDAFIKSGNLLLSILDEKKENTGKYIFTTRSGFQAGADKKMEKTEYYIQLNMFDNNSYLPLGNEDFQKLIGLLVTAKSKL